MAAPSIYTSSYTAAFEEAVQGSMRLASILCKTSASSLPIKTLHDGCYAHVDAESHQDTSYALHAAKLKHCRE